MSDDILHEVREGGIAWTTFNRPQARNAMLFPMYQRIQELADEISNDPSIPLATRLLLSLNPNSVITTADARRAALQDNLFEAQHFLNLAEDVESSRVVEDAAAVKTTARSRRSSVLVGALVGLLVGVIAALVAEPFVARRRAGPSQG